MRSLYSKPAWSLAKAIFIGSGVANDGLQRLLETGDDVFVRGVDLRIGQRAFRTAIGECISHALLSGRDVLPAKDIEQFDRFEMRGLGLFDNREHGVVG